MLAGDLDAVALEQLDDSGGRARQRRGNRGARIDPEHEPTEVGRVQPICVFCRVDELEDRILVDAVGQRKLHDKARDRGVVVEAAHGGSNLVEGGLDGQLDADRRHANLGAVTMLARHIRP